MGRGSLSFRLKKISCNQECIIEIFMTLIWVGYAACNLRGEVDVFRMRASKNDCPQYKSVVDRQSHCARSSMVVVEENLRDD